MSGGGASVEQGEASKGIRVAGVGLRQRIDGDRSSPELDDGGGGCVPAIRLDWGFV